MESGTVDAVSIATPIGLHFEQGMQCVDAGLHIHINKSMTTTVDEADQLIAAAAAKGVKLVSCPGEMLRPRHRRIKELIDEGVLGTLTWAVTGASFGRYHENERVRGGDNPLTNVNPAWYFRKPGGGPLYDMTVYGLHAMTGISRSGQRRHRVSGVRVKEREFYGQMLPTDMDDNTLMVLDFGDNMFAFVYGVAAGRLPNMGRPLIFPAPKVSSTAECLTANRSTIRAANWTKRSTPTPRCRTYWAPTRGLEEAHVYEDVMQLVDWIREDIPTTSTAEHARHVIEIFDAAYRSAQSGTAQELRTTF